jgi:uncharacterized membrane protein
MKEHVFLAVIGILAVIGLFISGYLVKEHYTSTGASFCDINDTFNCSAVNRSQYAVFLGVPVAALGLLYYLMLLGLALFGPALRRGLGQDNESYALLFVGHGLFGLLFSLYLTSIEAFVLHVFCPLCLTSAAIVLLLNGLAFDRWRLALRGKSY